MSFSCKGQDRSTTQSTLKIPSDSLLSIIKGRWQVSCENLSGQINIYNLDSMEIEINSNLLDPAKIVINERK